MGQLFDVTMMVSVRCGTVSRGAFVNQRITASIAQKWQNLVKMQTVLAAPASDTLTIYCLIIFAIVIQVSP